MTRILAVVVAVLFVVLAVLPVNAGEANSDGYIAADGYYFLPGSSLAYTRSAYTAYYWVPGTAGYWVRSGCCGGYQWVAGSAGYYQSYTAYNYSAVQLNPSAPDVEERLIELAKARDKGVLAIAKASQKSQAALALADKLGLSGNFNIPAYGQGIFPLTNYSSSQSVVTQGQTVYGYSTLTLEAKGVDLNALMQMYGQSVRDSQLYGDNARAGLKETVEQVSAEEGRVRETLAKGAAISQTGRALGKAVEPTGSLKITNSTATPQQPENLPPPKQSFVEARANVIQQACISCHGEKPKSIGQLTNNLSLLDYENLGDDVKDKVRERLTSTNPVKRMPLAVDGSAGPVLTQVARNAFFQ